MADSFRLSVSDTVADGIRGVVAMPNEDIEKLRQALVETEPSISPMKFSKRVADRFDETQRKQVEKTVQALLSMTSARIDVYKPIEEFINDAVNAVGSDNEQAVKPDDKDVFRQRISLLLNSGESMLLTAKAGALLTNHQNVAEKFTIVTDIRPVFPENTKENPRGIVLYHNLKIQYIEQEEEKNIFVALDGRDLSRLKDAVLRAEQKALSIGTWLDEKSITQLVSK